VHAQSLAGQQLEALVQNNTPPGSCREDRGDETGTEPQRHMTSDHQLPMHLTSAAFQTIFTQHQLDSALYGYAKYDGLNNHAAVTVGPALSGLRPTGLSYGNY